MNLDLARRLGPYLYKMKGRGMKRREMQPKIVSAHFGARFPYNLGVKSGNAKEKSARRR